MPAAPCNDDHHQQKFLPGLASALHVVRRQVEAQQPIKTLSFTKVIDRVAVVFDFLGSVLHFAKKEVVAKNRSLVQASAKHPNLTELVDADRRAGTVTVKDSGARNLHRLAAVIRFAALLLEKLVLNGGPSTTLREAASAAYESALAPMHPYVVRTAVRASMRVLPSRASFMEHIGETDESARPAVQDVVASSKQVVAAVDSLYDVAMPATQSTAGLGIRSWFGRGGGCNSGTASH